MIKASSKEVYLCPQCRGEIEKRVSKWPNCGIKLIWRI